MPITGNPLGTEIEFAELNAATQARIPTALPVAVAEGGTGSPTADGAPTALGFTAFAKTLIDDADAATARTTLGAEDSGAAAAVQAAEIMPYTRAIAALAPSSADEPVAYPGASMKVASIAITARNTAPTAGTIAFTNGSTGAGNTMLNAATFDLSTLTANTKTTLTLTGTAADLQAPADGCFTMTIDANDQPIVVAVQFARQ